VQNPLTYENNIIPMRTNNPTSGKDGRSQENKETSNNTTSSYSKLSTSNINLGRQRQDSGSHGNQSSRDKRTYLVNPNYEHTDYHKLPNNQQQLPSNHQPHGNHHATPVALVSPSKRNESVMTSQSSQRPRSEYHPQITMETSKKTPRFHVSKPEGLNKNPPNEEFRRESPQTRRDFSEIPALRRDEPPIKQEHINRMHRKVQQSVSVDSSKLKQPPPKYQKKVEENNNIDGNNMKSDSASNKLRRRAKKQTHQQKQLNKMSSSTLPRNFNTSNSSVTSQSNMTSQQPSMTSQTNITSQYDDIDDIQQQLNQERDEEILELERRLESLSLFEKERLDTLKQQQAFARRIQDGKKKKLKFKTQSTMNNYDELEVPDRPDRERFLTNKIQSQNTNTNNNQNYEDLSNCTSGLSINTDQPRPQKTASNININRAVKQSEQHYRLNPHRAIDKNIVRRESSGRSQQRPVSDGFYLQNARITSNKVDPASMSFKDRMKMFQNK